MKQFAVIGDPISHSLSPVLHKEIYRQFGIDASFEKTHVTPASLSIFMNRNVLDGFNVTIPYKESIIPYLDALDESAEVIAAVNCVAGEIGYNTDWIGFLKAMVGNGIEINEKNCLIIGAGGAARAVGYALVKAKAKSIIFQNRTKSRADQLSAWINKLYPENEPSERVDILINCTPVGMWPDTNATPIDFQDIDENHVLADTIYNPLETEWLKRGISKGAKIVNGLDMFIAQGLASADIWFGEKISKKIDLEPIKKVLKSKLC
tara:strand:- start:176 stop:967 length:792 start_codon:yes stop_codon:yes gene_type:complete